MCLLRHWNFTFQVSLAMSLCDLSVTWLIMSAMKTNWGQSCGSVLLYQVSTCATCQIDAPAFWQEVFSLLLLSTAFIAPFQDIIVLSLPNLSNNWSSLQFLWVLHPNWLKSILPPFLQCSIFMKHSIHLMNVTYTMPISSWLCIPVFEYFGFKMGNPWVGFSHTVPVP